MQDGRMLREQSVSSKKLDMGLSYISAFDPSEDKKRNLASKILYISESVIKFFWDDAPRLGIQQREGPQDMAFDVPDAIKSGVML